METQIIQPEKKVYIPCQHSWVLTQFACCSKWKCSSCGKIYSGNDSPTSSRIIQTSKAHYHMHKWVMKNINSYRDEIVCDICGQIWKHGYEYQFPPRMKREGMFMMADGIAIGTTGVIAKSPPGSVTKCLGHSTDCTYTTAESGVKGPTALYYYSNGPITPIENGTANRMKVRFGPTVLDVIVIYVWDGTTVIGTAAITPVASTWVWSSVLTGTLSFTTESVLYLGWCKTGGTLCEIGSYGEKVGINYNYDSVINVACGDPHSGSWTNIGSDDDVGLILEYTVP